MDFKGSDTIQLKYPINTLFSNTIITIYPHFMPIDLKPFIKFATISTN